MTSPGNVDIEALLESLPEEVANALMEWRLATLEREKTDAILHASIKGQDNEATATDIKARIHANPDHYEVVLKEIKKEANYTLLYERLLSAKKRASLRTAY